MINNTELITEATKLFTSGYNCSQSVTCAHCENLGVSHEAGRKLSAGFGGGIGGLRRTCGALTGAVIIAGLKFGDYDPTDKVAKTKYYNLIKKLESDFTDKFGTSNCKELLTEAKAHFEDSPMARNAEYYTTRPCAVFVDYASKLVESLLTTTEQ